MPKLKSHSGAKKRFKITKNGKGNKFIGTQSGKQHNMRKRSGRALRDQRGTALVGAYGSKILKKLLPK
ncbi:50S ribosomal protein L35 [Anaplasmataceae bacterium AB001_6]|nr:50S ribosomal protein L35 [Anaplasmataceae bacterium AB001_6]